LETNQDLEELRLNVTSPGGITEQALTVLERGRLKELFEEALKAARQRTEDLRRSNS
jgi:pyrroline-5-carboxylate reductase